MPSHILWVEDLDGTKVDITGARIELHSMSPHEGATTVTLQLTTPHPTSLRIHGAFAPQSFCMDEDSEPLTDFDIIPQAEGQDYVVEVALAKKTSKQLVLRWIVPFAPVGEVGEVSADGRRVAYMLPVIQRDEVVDPTTCYCFIDWGSLTMQLDFVSSASRKLLDSTISQGAIMGYSTTAVTGTEPIALVITVRRSEAVDNEKAVGGGVKSERKKLYTTILMGGVVLLFAFGFGGIFAKKPGDKTRLPM